jgi:hypothetical protein
VPPYIRVYICTYTPTLTHKHIQTHTCTYQAFYFTSAHSRLIILVGLFPFILSPFYGSFIFIYDFLIYFHFCQEQKLSIKQSLGVYVFYRCAMKNFSACWRPFTWNRSDHISTSNPRLMFSRGVLLFSTLKFAAPVRRKENLLS